MAAFNFKVSDAPAESNDFGVLPAGRYSLVVLESSLELTKKAKEANDPSLGQYVKVKLQVINGAYQNRYIWSNFNVVNSNPKAVEIGQQQFGNLISSCGLEEIGDTSELNEKVVSAEIKVTPDTGYGVGNDVKRFYPATSAPAPAATPAPAAGGPVQF